MKTGSYRQDHMEQFILQEQQINIISSTVQCQQEVGSKQLTDIKTTFYIDPLVFFFFNI